MALSLVVHIVKEVKPPQNFSLARVHRSKFEFGALRLVLVKSPSSGLEIMHHFFFVGFLTH